jgi:hypothetical protein
LPPLAAAAPMADSRNLSKKVVFRHFGMLSELWSGSSSNKLVLSFPIRARAQIAASYQILAMSLSFFTKGSRFCRHDKVNWGEQYS